MKFYISGINHRLVLDKMDSDKIYRGQAWRSLVKTDRTVETPTWTTNTAHSGVKKESPDYFTFQSGDVFYNIDLSEGGRDPEVIGEDGYIYRILFDQDQHKIENRRDPLHGYKGDYSFIFRDYYEAQKEIKNLGFIPELKNAKRGDTVEFSFSLPPIGSVYEYTAFLPERDNKGFVKTRNVNGRERPIWKPDSETVKAVVYPIGVTTSLRELQEQHGGAFCDVPFGDLDEVFTTTQYSIDELINTYKQAFSLWAEVFKKDAGINLVLKDLSNGGYESSTPRVIKYGNFNEVGFSTRIGDIKIMCLDIQDQDNVFSSCVNNMLAYHTQGYSTVLGQNSNDGASMILDVKDNVFVDGHSSIKGVPQKNPAYSLLILLVHEIGHYLGLNHQYSATKENVSYYGENFLKEGVMQSYVIPDANWSDAYPEDLMGQSGARAALSIAYGYDRRMVDQNGLILNSDNLIT